jgi:hypothetical protein
MGGGKWGVPRRFKRVLLREKLVALQGGGKKNRVWIKVTN